jgi:hypothetical protein
MREVHAEAALFDEARVNSTAAAGKADADAKTTTSSLWLRARRIFSQPHPALSGLAVALLLVIGGMQLFGGTPPATTPQPPPAEVISAVGKPSIQAKLILRGDQGTLVARNLPPLRRGRVYQVWLQQKGGVLRPTDTLFTVRRGSATVTLPDLGASSKVLITSEPEGGSTQPSRSPILGFNV